MGRSSGSAESWPDVKNMVAILVGMVGRRRLSWVAYVSIERWAKRLWCRMRWRR